MNQKGTKIFTIVIFLVAMVVLTFYVRLSNDSATKQDETAVTEKDKLLQYDMENDYPKTARETVKLHCRYLKYIYSDEFEEEGTDEDLAAMNQKIRKLFAEELLEINSQEKHLQALKDEIALYELNKQKFVSYTLAEGSQIEYNTENDVEYARMRVTIAMSIDGASASVDEEYLLRQDEDGKWKILGWQIKGQNQIEEEGENE